MVRGLPIAILASMARLGIIFLVAILSMAATRASSRMTATAYCQGGITKSGAPARTGIVAADPAVLPIGTVLKIVSGTVTGIYTVMDTGRAVKGRKIDIFIPNCGRANRFGSQRLLVRILRRGWDPKGHPGRYTRILSR
jgi:3D (Asp-Asp-Asp) domain-containing protein